MNARAALSRRLRSLVEGILMLGVPLSAPAYHNVPPETLDVKAYPELYIAAGKPFTTLAALEAWAKSILIREVWVDSCGPSSAPRALAAAERFQSVHKKAIRVRSRPFGDRDCILEADRAIRTH